VTRCVNVQETYAVSLLVSYRLNSPAIQRGGRSFECRSATCSVAIDPVRVFAQPRPQGDSCTAANMGNDRRTANDRAEIDAAFLEAIANGRASPADELLAISWTSG
jgi:hypothetical protein